MSDNPWADLTTEDPAFISDVMSKINEHIAIWYINTHMKNDKEPEEIEENLIYWLDEITEEDADEWILLGNVLGLLIDYDLIDFNEVSTYVKANW